MTLIDRSSDYGSEPSDYAATISDFETTFAEKSATFERLWNDFLTQALADQG